MKEIFFINDEGDCYFPLFSKILPFLSFVEVKIGMLLSIMILCLLVIIELEEVSKQWANRLVLHDYHFCLSIDRTQRTCKLFSISYLLF